MNIVVCRHPGDSGKYIFKVPEDVSIDAGTLLKVETGRGVQPAQAITSSFKADPEIICPLWGTQPKKMKKVLSYLLENAIEWPEDQEDIPFSDLDDELPE